MNEGGHFYDKAQYEKSKTFPKIKREWFTSMEGMNKVHHSTISFT